MSRFPVKAGEFSLATQGGAKDAFGRLRVSNPVGIWDSQFQYDLQPNLYFTSGDVTHLPNESSARLAVTTTSGDRSILQSRAYIRYQPGKSQQIMQTFAFGAGQAGTLKRAGYYDDENGLFIEQEGTNISVVKRSKITGAVVDTKITSGDWNGDRHDGSGTGGVTIDTTKSQILMIDIEWLGAGSARFSLLHRAEIHKIHEFHHSNETDGTYITTANLPIRWEILNTATQVATSDMKAICAGVSSEGGFDSELGFPFSASNKVTEVAVTTRRPILSIRHNERFNGITNKIAIILDDAKATARTNSAYLEIVLGGTLTNAVWASVDAGNSGMDRDISADAITGGATIHSTPIVAGQGSNQGLGEASIGLKTPIGLDIDGKNPTSVSIVATSYTGTSNLAGTINWRELR